MVGVPPTFPRFMAGYGSFGGWELWSGCPPHWLYWGPNARELDTGLRGGFEATTAT